MSIAIASGVTRADLNRMPSGTATAANDIPANSVAYITAGGQLSTSIAAAGGNAGQVYVKTAIPTGTVGSYYAPGSVIDGLVGLIPGSTYYLSKTVAGGINIAPATGILGSGVLNQSIGTALSSTSLLFNPFGVTLL